jgi:hypothetical protein
LTTCHVDGDMKRLWRLFADVGVDIAEGVSPSPLCNYTLAEAQDALAGRMTIWGGIPTPLFTTAYTDEDFELYVTEVLRTVAGGRHFILSMGDNIPSDGVFERVYRVPGLLADVCDQFDE